MCLLFSGFSPVYLSEACAVYSGITRRARFLEGGDSLIGRGAGGDGCPITNGNTSHALNTHYKMRLGLLAEGHLHAAALEKESKDMRSGKLDQIPSEWYMVV